MQSAALQAVFWDLPPLIIKGQSKQTVINLLLSVDRPTPIISTAHHVSLFPFLHLVGIEAAIIVYNKSPLEGIQTVC